MNQIKNAAKIQDFKHGKTMYKVNSSGMVDTIFILGRPYKNHNLQLFGDVMFVNYRNYAYNYDYSDSLGDCGVPGCTYDSRKPQIYTKRKSAEKAAIIAKREKDSHSVLAVDNHYDDCDADYDYYDSDEDNENYLRLAKASAEIILDKGEKSFIWDIHHNHPSSHIEVCVVVKDVTYFGYAVDSRRVRIEYSIQGEDIEDNLMYLCRGNDQVWRVFGQDLGNANDWHNPGDGKGGKDVSVLFNNALNQKVFYNNISHEDFINLRDEKLKTAV